MILLDSPCVLNPPVFQTRSCKPWTTHDGFNFDPQTSPPKPSFTAPLEPGPSWAIDRRLHCRVARVACADRWAPNHRGYSCSNPPQKAGWARINGEKTGIAFDTTRIDPKKDGIWETAINIPSAKIPISMNQLSVLSEVLYQGFLDTLSILISIFQGFIHLAKSLLCATTWIFCETLAPFWQVAEASDTMNHIENSNTAWPSTSLIVFQIFYKCAPYWPSSSDWAKTSFNLNPDFSEASTTSGFLLEIDQLMKTSTTTIARSYSRMRGSYKHHI